MADYLKRKIMTSDEMQAVVDQAITLTRIWRQLVTLPVVSALSQVNIVDIRSIKS